MHTFTHACRQTYLRPCAHRFWRQVWHKIEVGGKFIISEKSECQGPLTYLGSVSSPLRIVSVYQSPAKLVGSPRGWGITIACYVKAVQTNPLWEVSKSCRGVPGKHLERPKWMFKKRFIQCTKNDNGIRSVLHNWSWRLREKRNWESNKQPPPPKKIVLD